MEIEEQFDQEEIEQDADEMKMRKSRELPENDFSRPPRRAKNLGLILTLFAAVIVILVGALASYYYYNFQSQGATADKALRSAWGDTVKATEEVTSKFGQVTNFNDLTHSGSGSFLGAVGDANRVARDSLFDVRAQTGLSIAASTFASKLASFLEDYGTMLSEVKKVSEQAESVESLDKLDNLFKYKADAESSYDEMLLVAGSFAKLSLPRAIFDLPDDISQLLTKKIEENGTKEEQDKAQRQAAEQVVSQFVDGWRNRDPDAMGNLMTPGAKKDFNKGILEDSSDINSWRILESTLAEELKVEIKGNLEKTAPDDSKITEGWRFVLLKTNDKWLIDSWQKTS